MLPNDLTIEILAQLAIAIIGAGFGAIVGAYFGLKFAREWDRKKRQEELSDNRINALDSIIEELKEVKKEINKPQLGIYFSGGNEMTMDIPVTLPSAYESIVNSGTFSLLPTQLQTKIAGVYISVNQSNVIANQLYQKYYERPMSNESKLIIGQINGDFRQIHTLLIKEIDELLPILESAKNRQPT